MGRLIIRSFFDDIKNFKNMMLYRKQKIEESANKPLPESYGVNKLSEALHPDIQKAVITSVATIDNSMKIITLSSFDNADLAQFRAGQGINIKIGSETTFFPILSSPDEKNYNIVVFTDSSDEVSEYLSGAGPDTELEISGPTGLFYFSSLRDGDSIVVICDIFGFASAVSICKYVSAGACKSVKFFFLENNENLIIRSFVESLVVNVSVVFVKNEAEIYKIVSDQINSPVTFFVSGRQEFCSCIKNEFENFEFLKGNTRANVLNPSVKRDVFPKQYFCKVFYRNETFSFECFSNETILSAFKRNHIPTQAKCNVGECGYCRCKLIEGEVENVYCSDIDSRRSADEKYSFIHPCRAFPKTDIKVKL